jgi:hypothetical protein
LLVATQPGWRGRSSNVPPHRSHVRRAPYRSRRPRDEGSRSPSANVTPPVGQRGGQARPHLQGRTCRKLRLLELPPAPRGASRAPRPTASTRPGRPPPTIRPSGVSPSRPKPPTGAWSPTDRPAARRPVRPRHRSAHLKGPRSARPRRREQRGGPCGVQTPTVPSRMGQKQTFATQRRLNPRRRVAHDRLLRRH